MKAINNAMQAATVLLDSEAKYGDSAAWYKSYGVLKDDADMNEEEKARKKECKEAIYQVLSKREGGIAAKAARLTVDQWKDLTGHQKEEYQKERNRVKGWVDNRWARLRRFVKDTAEESAEKESGEPAPAKTKKTLSERWAAFEVESAKANKRTPEIDPAKFAEWQRTCRESLTALLKK